MIPASFVILDSLPVMSNGKTDRRSLQNRMFEATRPAETLAVPANPTEEFLVQIWKRELGVRQIGVDQNFYDLGGDSLIAQMIVNSIWETTRLSIPVGVLLRSPTIRAFSRALDDLPD